MAKQHRKANVVQTNQGNGHSIEEFYDDSPLPPAAELERLKLIDPNIIDWYKTIAEKEQEFRHTIFLNKQNQDAKKSQGERNINYFGLFISFVFIMSSLAFSFYLMYIGKAVLGSIFTGATTIAIVSSYLNFVRKN